MHASIIMFCVLQEMRYNNKEDIKYPLENAGKKITFIVKPIYKKSGENIHDILVKLMQRETRNP